jgi:hypothetical protein
VQGGFYGHALVADFIGLGDGELRVRKLKAATQQSPMVTAYAGFNAGKLSKIALTNQQYFQGTDRPESEKVRIHLGGVSDNLTVATVRRITSLTGDAHEDILYAGLDWRAENAGKPALVNDTNIAIPIIDGEMEFELPAMEAWLINW